MAINYLDDDLTKGRVHGYCPLEAYEQYTVVLVQNAEHARTAARYEWLEAAHVSLDETWVQLRGFSDFEAATPELQADGLNADYEQKLALLPPSVRSAIINTAGMFNFATSDVDDYDMLDDLLGD